ncbi:MAG: T9SS type A sorting domain-containing protein [Bacteroidales bacterium]|nr:T9SS type A sorting domain-containing protein [Bacteroidales bacterium]
MKNLARFLISQSLLKTGFVVLLSLIPSLIFAQTDDQWKSAYTDPQNFFSIWNNYDQYLATTYPDSIPSSKKAEIKPAIRFFKFWKSRIAMVNGQLSYSPYLNDILQGSVNPVCTGTDQAQWQLLGPSSLIQGEVQYQGLVTSVLNDPFNSGSYILSAEGGGIWKRQANSNQWVNKTDNLHLPAICATEILRDPFVNTHLYATTGKDNFGIGIIESVDNGETWSVIQGFPNSSAPFVRKIVYDRSDVNPNDGTTLYAMTFNQIYKSDNSGQTWSVFATPTILQFSSLYDIETAFDGNGIVILLSTFAKYSLQGQLFVFKNNVWQEITSTIPFPFQKSKFTEPVGNLIFAFYDEVTTRKIYRTTDYGTSWSFVKTLNGGNGPSEKAVIKYSGLSGIVYVGSVYLAMFKENNPQDIVSFSCMHDDIRDIDFCGINNGLESIIAATDGGIAKMTVNTSNIHDYNKESLDGDFLPIGTYVGLGVSHSLPEFIMAGATHNGTQKLQNGTWLHIEGGDGGDCLVNWDKPENYCWQVNGSLRSTTGYIGSSSGLWWMPYTSNPDNPYLIYAGANGTPSRLYIYNQKTNTKTTSNLPTNLIRPGAICVSSDNKIYISDDEPINSNPSYRFIVSSDNGATWNDLCGSLVYKPGWTPVQLGSLILWRTLERIVCNPDNPSEIWVTIGGLETNGGPTPVDGLHRVLHSQDGGQTWNDYSEGLTAFPAISIIYQPGSNKRLFVGTDAGVFYRDATMNQWECFNNGLPIVPISELEYSPCDKYLYASTYSRSMFKTPVPFDDVVTTIPSNTTVTWTQNKEISGDLIIESNSVLTLEGTLYMPKESKIIVKPSGKLVVNGGKLTSRCGLWTGIEVWGNSAQHQFTINGQCYQGTVELRNQALIENAYNAITLWHPGDYASMGGIIRANNAIFKNNRRAVEFISYDNFNPYNPNIQMNNLGYFSNCTFITDNTYIIQNPFYAFISMWDVEGININGCSFANTKDFNNNSNRGYGIYSMDAKYNVQPYCSSTSVPCPSGSVIYSSFQGLYAGITALNTMSTKTTSVNHAIFTDNSYGVKLSAVSNARIIFSEFHIGPNTNCPTFTGIGVELDQCNGYSIEENTFTDSNTWPIGANFIGVRVIGPETSSSILYNEIYHNYFDGITAGNVAESTNRSNVYPFTGLCYICNRNQPNVNYDFYIKSGGIAMYQGSATVPAGNIFAHTNYNPFSDLNNQGSLPIDYTYWGGNCGSLGVPGEQPLYTNNVYIASSSNQNPCLPHYGSGTQTVKLTDEQIAGYEQQFANSSVEYDNVRELYEILKDGGSTETLEDDIINSTPSQTMELRNELLGNSPHLSREVLETASDKFDVLPDAILLEILSANPDELRDEDLLTYLANRNPPFPNYMIELLRAIASDTTYKTTLQKQLKSLDADKTKAVYALLRDMLNDTTVELSVVRNWLDNLQNLQADYQIIDSYLQQGNTTSAMALVNLLPQLYAMDTNDINEYNLYKDLKTLQSDMINEGKNIYQLTQTQMAVLQDIAQNSTGLAGIQAQNILSFGYGFAYLNCAAITDDPVIKSAKKDRTKLMKLVYEPQVSVYPNPAHDWVSFTYTIPNTLDNSSLKIIDLKGHLVTTLSVKSSKGELVWDTRKVIPGTYCYTLTNGNCSTSGKVIVIH